jgi:TonB-dependent starch-binding outer membrane protein SusC
MIQKISIMLSGLKQKLTCYMLLLCMAIPAMAQDKTVSGTITDATGTPLPGVVVVVKGKTNNTVTDISGKYNIKCSVGDVISCSFLGYQTKEATIGNETNIDLSLTENVQELNEVVVIGYGVQKKSDLTGSVASVSSKDIRNMPVTRVDEALQGKAAGVQIFQNSGQPGSEPKIRVRGLATVNGGSPLVVIDGVSGGSLSSINPGDIESMEILKDAASQAIYGSAGANGVILITTKRGKTNSFNANVDMYWGTQEPWSKDNVEVCNAQQYAALYNRTPNKANYFKTSPTTGLYMDAVDTLQNLTDTRWVDKIFRSSAFTHNYNVSINGGTKNTNVYSSFGYSGEEGTLLRTYNNKYTFKLNGDVQIIKRLKVGESFSFSHNENSTQGEHSEYGSPLATAIQMLPIVPIYAADGTGNYAYKGSNLSCNVNNPLAQIEYNNNVATTKAYFGNAYLRFEILDGLNFESHYGFNHSEYEYLVYTPVHVIGDTASSSATFSVPVNSFNKNTNSTDGWQWQNYFTYDLNLAEIHKFNFVAGMESGYSKYKFVNKTATGVNMVGDFKDYSDTTGLNPINPEKINITKGYAYFGRANYDLANILLLQGNVRYDFSSKFGPNYRSGIFPAGSIGIKFSEIGAVKDLNIIDFGKIRYGIGETGNSDIQPFLYTSSIGTGILNNKYSFNGVVQNGAALITAGNADLHWETIVTQNIGIDLGILKNRVSISFDYFTRRNKDMLLRKSVPDYVGYKTPAASQELGDPNLDTRPLVNYGTLDNSGYEITLGYKDKFGDFNVDLNTNLTHTVTKIDDIGEPLYAGSGRGLANVCQTKNGDVVSAFYGYKIIGTYKEDEFIWYQTLDTKNKAGNWKRIAPDNNGKIVVKGLNESGDTVYINTMSTAVKSGYFKYQDANGDGIIDVNDMVNIGNPNPKFTYGFNANFEYKGIELSMFFQGSYGNDIFNMLKVNLYGMNNGGLNWSPELLNAYIPATYNTSDRSIKTPVRNENSTMQSMDADLSQSDFYVEDGSYLRLKNIQIGYTLPSSFTKKVKIEKLKIYVGAKNLLTFTNYKGFDPEVGEDTNNTNNSILQRGFDRGTYPQSKMYILGLNLSF